MLQLINNGNLVIHRDSDVACEGFHVEVTPVWLLTDGLGLCVASAWDPTRLLRGPHTPLAPH